MERPGGRVVEWTVPLESTLAAPMTVTDDTLYFTTQSSGAYVFHAFDPATQAVMQKSLDVVRASTTEVYATESVPADAGVYFRGVDEHAGAMTKYVRIEPYANP